MLQNILTALRLVVSADDPARREVEAHSAPWQNDPLSHPRLASMSLVEIADLPFAEFRPCGRE